MSTGGSLHETVDGEPSRSRAIDDPSVGSTIARYVILGRLGAGAMGVVYAAWDPELDRRVAIKVLHPGVRSGSQGRSRLLREAQALAKLSHPNVVTVHDVGTVRDRVWIAMEFVEGLTVHAWLRAAPRRWHDILDVMCEAGRGLATAHAAGIVHRDFKPENVMVSQPLRVRVMDFGLARTEPSKPSSASQSPVEIDRTRDVSVTRSGATVGTPAYMAPEQHSRLPADARSDQFSFCVSLWEALYGQRPYSGETAVELAANVIAGRLRPPPPNVRIPKWLRRAIMRGLGGDPDKRWPTMDALLDRIARGRARARLRRPLFAAITIALVASTAAVAQEIGERARIESCTQESEAFASIWKGQRVGVLAAVSAASLPDARQSARRIVDTIDRNVALWTEVRTDACLALHVEGSWNPETYERASWCLEERRLAIRTILAVLEDPNPEHVRRAVEATDHEAGISRCGDVNRLAHLPPPPPELRLEVLDRIERLLRATELLGPDDFEAALATARSELRRNEELGWTPLVAESRLHVGTLLEQLGRFDEAEQALEACYFEAARVDAIEIAMRAATRLVLTTGARLARFREGLRWSREAELLLVRLGEEDGLSKATLLSQRAGVEYAQGDYAAARASIEEGLAIRERLLDPGHTDIAASLGHLANVEFAMSNAERSKSLLQRALEIDEAGFGPSHPQVAVDLANLGNTERALGNFDEAERLLQQSIEIQRAALGSQHPDVGSAINNLAAVYLARGDRVRARELAQQSVEIKRVVLGEDHPEFALGLLNIAGMYAADGKVGPAKELAEQALTIYEASVGPEHREVAFALDLLAQIALDQERFADAAEMAEREVKIIAASPTDHDNLPAARFMLARALWANASARTRARELATAARGQLRDEGKATDEIDEWLRQHAQ